MRQPYSSDARFAVRPHPVHCRDASLHSFLLPAPQEALDALVGRHLGGDVRARAAAPLAWLIFADLPWVGEAPGAPGALGGLEEREAALWVPLEWEDEGRVHRGWTVPYMFVDNGAALSAGRELFGLPKELGQIAIEPEDGRLTATVETVDRRSSSALAAPRALIRVERGAARGPGLRQLMRRLPALGRALRGAGGMSLTQLRQLPCIDRPDRAAHSELVRFGVELLGAPRVRRLGGTWQLHLANTDMHPLREDLGLTDVVTSPLAVTIDVDFALTRGTSLGPPRRPSRAAPRRLAVLGGGMASLSAVWELTQQPDWRSRWDITVYTPGWRLGGKTASSRNGSKAQRSEEHGLHIWFGFYYNAFRLLRQVYAELDRPEGHPLQRADQALVPQSRVVFHEEWRGRPARWIVDYPGDARFPGGEEVRRAGFTTLPPLRGLLRRGLTMLVDTLRGRPPMQSYTEGLDRPRVTLRGAARALLRGGGDLSLALLRLERVSESLDTAERMTGAMRRLLRTRIEAARGALRSAAGDLQDLHPDVFHLYVMADTALTMARGIVVDDVIGRGFDAIDGEDFRAWLTRHGANEPVVRSAPLKALYDASFSYADGDAARPDLAAGAGLAAVLRIVFAYEGAVLWKAPLGMGEAVVAPLYEALAARGVRFEFFHQIDALRLDGARRRIDRIELTRQARVLSPPYRPLVTVNGVDCWPDRPRVEQLAEGHGLSDRAASLVEAGVDAIPGRAGALERGRDFDEVLLGIGLGALPRLCEELVDARPAWSRMLSGLRSVRTQAGQLWLSESPSGDGAEAIDNLTDDQLPSWIDMAPVLRHESWERPPGGLVYTTGVMAETTRPADAEEAVHRHLDDALRERGREVLGDGNVERARYVCANLHGSQRYERAASGTAHLRLAPDQSGFDNLTLAGAWTRTGFHIGSIEAAVMSGALAAAALDGRPRDVVGASIPKEN